MKGNKIHCSQKNRLVLVTYPQNASIKNNIENDYSVLLISNSIQKRNCSISSKQVIKNRIYHEEKVSNIKIDKQNLEKEFKLRAVSTSHKLKLIQSNSSKAYVKNPSERIKEVSQSADPYPLNSLVTELIDLLKSKSIINQNHLLFYTIKKDHLHAILKQFLQIRQNSHFHGKYQSSQSQTFDFMTNKMKDLSTLLYSKNLQLKKAKNVLKSNFISFQYHNQFYHSQISQYKNELEVLRKQKNELQDELKNLHHNKQQIIKEFKLKQQEITQQMKMVSANKENLFKLQSKTSETFKELEEKQEILNQIKDKTDTIENYVNNQNNKHLIMASEEYKNIEGDIYEYASYLQCNQLASSPTYEPLSITCLTEDLQTQIKNVNKTIIQNQQITAVDKSKMMRDFLVKWMDRFKRKDEEQKELINFKTKCVVNFVNKMKKWLDNWSFKQQYLVNLRNEFAFDSEKMINLIKSLQTFTNCNNCGGAIDSVRTEITKIYNKIEQNYKLGNSFY